MRTESMVWYGPCTFWTEDWDKLGDMEGIPLCPCCGAPGFQSSKGEWFGGIEAFERSAPGYANFVEALRETCHGRGVTIKSLWDQHSASEGS